MYLYYATAIITLLSPLELTSYIRSNIYSVIMIAVRINVIDFKFWLITESRDFDKSWFCVSRNSHTSSINRSLPVGARANQK